MITLFSSSLGLMAVKKKRELIEYTDMLIYMGNLILLLMKSTMPETSEMIRILKSDPRLEGFDFSLEFKDKRLKDNDAQRIRYLFYSIGRYDIDSQIHITEEFIGYFKLLNKQYQDYYNRHYKLYIVFGIFGGIMVSVLLI